MSRFNNIAHMWDAKPRRLKIANDIFNAIDNKIIIDSNMVVADIGVGTGLLLIHFHDLVKRIEGYDNSKGMIDIFNSKLKKAGIKNASAFLFNADKDILQENYFDLVVSSLTFHHISDVEKLISNIYNSLKKGGKICIADLESEDGTFHSEPDDSIKHLGFDNSYFESIMKRVGFANTSINTIGQIEKTNKNFPVFLAYGEKL